MISQTLIFHRLRLLNWGDWKRGSGKRGSSENAGVEIAGVENAAPDCTAGVEYAAVTSMESQNSRYLTLLQVGYNSQ